MTKEDYLKTQMTICRLAEVVNLLDLGSFLNAIETAEAVGPVLDPTLWIKAYNDMARVRELAAAFCHVQRARHEMRQHQSPEINVQNEICARATLAFFQQ